MGRTIMGYRNTGIVGIAGLIALVALAGCTLVPPPPGPAPLRYRDELFATVTKQADLAYGSAPDAAGNPVSLTLDLYEPAGDGVTARPAVVWVHGGGFTTGSKTAGNVVDLATASAKRGYVAVSIDYRLLSSTGCGGNPTPTGSCIEAAIAAQHDAQAAVRWLRANAGTYRVDPDRIAMGGTSAGAVTSLLAAYRSDDPGTSGNPGYSSTVGAAVSISGGLPDTSAIGAGDAPALLFHGTADTTVPYQWAVDVTQAAQATGLVAILETLLGAGHVPYTQYRDLFVSQSANFLYAQLDLAHAAA